MTVLETFYLIFKSNASGTKSEVAGIDKQLDELEKKGKKRSDNENKQFKELKKQRKELIDQLKEQQRETDKLDDSFQNMISSAVGAVTAYTSFSALKSGLIDANRLNASLAIMGKTTGQNAGEIKALGAALEQVGGKSEDLYDFTQSQALFAAQHRTPLPPIGDYIRRLHEQVKNLPPQQALTYLQQIPGAVSLAPLLQLPDDQFNAAIAGGHATARLRAIDEQAALENQEAYAKTRQAFSSLATEIDTSLMKAIKHLNEGLQGLAQSLQGHPNVALGSGVLAGIASAVGGWWASAKLWQGVKSLGGFSGGAATGAATSSVASGAVAGASRLGAVGLIAAAVWEGMQLAGAAGRWVGSNLPGSANAPAAPVVLRKAGGSQSSRQRVMDFWIAQGYSPGAAAGWAANAEAESSFNPFAVNGSHVGLYQWDANRRARIRSELGIDLTNAPLEKHLEAAAWEAKKYGLGPGQVPDDAAAAAALISNKYEVPALTPAGLAAEASKRARIAAGYGIVPTTAGAVADGDRSVSVKIDDVHIVTSATDATGIAREVGEELKNQIRMAMSNFDDGVLY